MLLLVYGGGTWCDSQRGQQALPADAMYMLLSKGHADQARHRIKQPPQRPGWHGFALRGCMPPGYGWSSPPTRRGCNITSVAATLDALMSALGYSRYVAQGGDWGAIACRALAV
jgi:pimeloyl-ACP methyl ester carboxylesterase